MKRLALALSLALQPALANAQGMSWLAGGPDQSIPFNNHGLLGWVNWTNGCTLQYQTGTAVGATNGYPVCIQNQISVVTFGAKGDGVTDDTAAFAKAIAAVNTSSLAGKPACLFLPVGIFYINGATLPSFAQNTGGGVCGSGSWKSIIKLGTAYAGDLFSWSDSWYAGVPNAGLTTLVNPTKLGARAVGFTVFGDRTAPAVQNALVFYDHNDQVFIDDFAVDMLNGRAFYAGAMKNDTQAYMRESVLRNIRIWHAGTATAPAFELTAQCSGAGCTGSDGTNEINLSDLNIYASAGLGFAIRNAEPSGAGGIADIKMTRVRVEADDIATVNSDLVWWGDASMAGKLSRISCSQCEFINTPATYYAFRIGGQTQPNTLFYDGSIVSNAGNGIRIDSGNAIYIHGQGIATGGTTVTIASSVTVGGPIVIDDKTGELTFTWSVDSSSLKFLTNNRNVWGIPGANGWLAPYMTDNSFAGGNQRGAGATDWQTNRFDPQQVAAAQWSTIGGGNSNTITSFSTGGTIPGGANNSVGSFYGSVTGGYGNLSTGSFTVAGGKQSSTLLLYGVEAYASGQFSAQGDAQVLRGVLRAATTSTTPTLLTADFADPSPSPTTNHWNIPDNYAVTFDLSCVYRDTTTLKVQSWKYVGVILARGVGVASTALAAPAASAGQNIGSPGATAPTLSADTTNGGLNISFTAPNSNASHIVCGMSGVGAG